METLANGEYLGTSSYSVENDSFIIKDSVHRKSASKTHIHTHDYLSILLFGSYLETSELSTKRILPGSMIYRPAGYPHKNLFEGDRIKCLNIALKEDWFRKNEVMPKDKLYHIN